MSKVESIFSLEIQLRMAIQEEMRRLEAQRAQRSVQSRYRVLRGNLVHTRLTSGKLERLTRSLESLLNPKIRT